MLAKGHLVSDEKSFSLVIVWRWMSCLGHKGVTASAKMLTHGLDGNTQSWILSWSKNHAQHVLSNGSMVLSGALHGCVGFWGV